MGFEGGLGIWEGERAFELIFKEKMKDIKVGANSVEVYFESEQLEDL